MILAADTIFRVETPEQMLALRDSAREGGAEVAFPGGMNPTYWARRWWTAIASGHAFVLATEDGACIGGLLTDDWQNGDRIAIEGFWFVPQRVRDGRGLELLRAWERAAKDAGAKRLYLGHHGDERMGRFYQRFGYEPTETVSVKVV